MTIKKIIWSVVALIPVVLAVVWALNVSERPKASPFDWLENDRNIKFLVMTGEGRQGGLGPTGLRARMAQIDTEGIFDYEYFPQNYAEASVIIIGLKTWESVLEIPNAKDVLSELADKVSQLPEYTSMFMYGLKFDTTTIPENMLGKVFVFLNFEQVGESCSTDQTAEALIGLFTPEDSERGEKILIECARKD